MYPTLIYLHSINRWLVLVSLIYAIYMSWAGLQKNRNFSSANNTVRHLTATIAHIQLLLGLYLYMISPIVKFKMPEVESVKLVSEPFFFEIVHLALMFIAVVVITIASAKAKRAETGRLKFKTMFIW
ncbi:MAG TPA: hypothetical protein VGN64_22450, partial [Dyadobacter sp.]|nr:hypothetical protein [Dyadobacter sp.]